MKNSNNVTKISDYTLETELDSAWSEVRDRMATVKAYNKIMPKAIPRAGKSMEKALVDFIEAVRFYDELRSKR
jgi:hypothetical protein